MRNVWSTIIILAVILASTIILGASAPDITKTTPTPGPTSTPLSKSTPTNTPTDTPTKVVVLTDTPTSTPTDTPVVVVTPTNTDTPTATVVIPTPTTGAVIAPYPSAPLCPDSGTAHELNVFHTLWDSARGCHYDHEHGTNPFVTSVAAAFPGFDLLQLLGGVQIGHTDPSSPAENTTKHGGFKWQVDTAAPHGCELGFESGTVAIDAYAIQYHEFGPQSVEFEARRHSAAALLRQCTPTNPADKGYIYVVQLQEFGQRTAPYQGAVLEYPDNFQPEYPGGDGEYFTTDCIGTGIIINGISVCRVDLNFIISRQLNANTIWTSKPTGTTSPLVRPPTSTLLQYLFRGRDTYQVLDSADLVYPFTYRWVCGDTVYNPAGCRYNNSTATVQEIAGYIPAAWDGASFDTDPRSGRVSVEGFVTRYGVWNSACVAADPALDCYPIKTVSAFVGKYSSLLVSVKPSNPTPQDTPERDIYFCGGVQCNETDPGAVPSGWIGAGN